MTRIFIVYDLSVFLKSRRKDLFLCIPVCGARFSHSLRVSLRFCHNVKLRQVQEMWSVKRIEITLIHSYFASLLKQKPHFIVLSFQTVFSKSSDDLFTEHERTISITLQT